MRIITPFEEISKLNKTYIVIGWFVLLFGTWIFNAFGSTHLFPTPSQVFNGFTDLYREGLVVHIFSSVWLCTQSVFISILISLSFCYLSPLPILKPIATFVSKFRYLPLTGISFYIAILIRDARMIQVWVLVVFMTTFLTTSLLTSAPLLCNLRKS